LFANVVLKNMLYDLATEKVIQVMAGKKLHYVVGLDARGFILGSVLAERFNCGFVTMRKFGKLGGDDCYSEQYGKEYGKDAFEIVKTIMKPDKNVLIVDDILATGGTLNAAKVLCDKFLTDGGESQSYGLIVDDISIFRETAKQKLGEFYDRVAICL
jgi:adenine phosphoribosyltransferase